MRFSKTVYLMDRILILFILLALLLLASLSYIFLVSSLSRTYLFLLGIALVLGFLVYLSYWWVYIPYKETNKVFQLFTEGYILKGVFDVRSTLTGKQPS